LVDERLSREVQVDQPHDLRRVLAQAFAISAGACAVAPFRRRTWFPWVVGQDVVHQDLGLVDQANTKLDLARVLNVLKRPEEAIREARAARELFVNKADRPGANQARALLNELGDRE
jgi:hypothetical protein